MQHVCPPSQCHGPLCLASEVTTQSLRGRLLEMAARADRGQTENPQDNTQIKEIIDKLELAMIGQGTTARLDGKWELVWASEDVTRSSPFFWAFRQAYPDNADQVTVGPGQRLQLRSRLLPQENRQRGGGGGGGQGPKNSLCT